LKYSDIYDSTKTKRVSKKWFNLPIDKAKYILKGLLVTDGCDHKELVFDSTSRNLIESARFICFKLGVLTSGYIRDRIGESHATSKGIITNKKLGYCLRIPRTKEICDLMDTKYNQKQFFKFFRYKNFLLSRITKITEEYYSGTLYDLQMKKKHNYMLHHGIVHNGGGRRKGAFATYMEPWHADIEDFLDLKKNNGKEEQRCRDLFYGLWIPDLFMKRVESDDVWSLFCPNECPGLFDCWGDEFDKLYIKYEDEGRERKTMKAQDLWFQIVNTQIETGMPYMMYKDACNSKSNQKNLGTIRSSNLCTEIVEYTSSDEISVCNLSSIALPMFVKDGKFDFNLLYEVLFVIVDSLDKIIDRNYYPVIEAKNSNMRHRPIGIGVQGLADLFCILRYF
jgi:hypothetical protein